LKSKRIYITFFYNGIPYCSIGNFFQKENIFLKDENGLVGDKKFKDFYPTFLKEYGEYPYYGRYGDDIVILAPFRSFFHESEEERSKIFQDFETFKKIIKRAFNGKKCNLFVAPVYPVKFFYVNSTKLPVENVFFLKEVKGRLKIISKMTINPFLCVKSTPW